MKKVFKKNSVVIFSRGKSKSSVKNKNEKSFQKKFCGEYFLEVKVQVNLPRENIHHPWFFEN